MKPVVVVGAGVVGASVAYHLAAAGVPVTLVDRLRIPAAGVTGASFAWIGDRGGDWPGGAADLRAFVRADHDRLAATVDGVAVRWTGSLRWPGSAPEDGQSWVGPAEITKLEPCLATVPDRAVHTPSDGGVDPVAMTSALVAAASRLEARVLTVTEVDDPREFGTTVVLAAGTGVAALSARVGAPVAVPPSPACLVRARARPGVIRTVVATPDFEARQLPGGEVLVTVPCTPSRTRGSRAPSRTPAELMPSARAPSRTPAAEMTSARASRMASSRASQQTLAALAMDRLRSHFQGEFQLVGYRVEERPMPDGGPVIGWLTPDVYVAVMHSAVTLGPTVGRLVAEELISGQPAPELARCRPR